MAIGGIHPVGHKKHWYVPAKDERLPAGAAFLVSGDSSVLWLQGYNVRVSTCATVLEQPLRTDKKVLVCLDEIDGDRNVNVFIRKDALKQHNRYVDGSKRFLMSGLTDEQKNEAKLLGQTLLYDEMNEDQMALIVKFEVEEFKPKIIELFVNGFTEAQVQEKIHDWWLDYQMADGAEAKLSEFASVIAKGPKALSAMMRFKEEVSAELKAQNAEPSGLNQVLKDAFGRSTGAVSGVVERNTGKEME